MLSVQVNTYIEDCIAQKDPLIKILRLVCMQSVCNNGLKQKVLDHYKREILQVESETWRYVFSGGVFSVSVHSCYIKKKEKENDGTFTQELPEVGRVDKNCAQSKVLLLFKIRSKSQSKVLTETTWVESNKKEIKPREKVYLMLCLVVGMTRIFSTADGLPRIKARQRSEHTPVLISSETINHHLLFR